MKEIPHLTNDELAARAAQEAAREADNAIRRAWHRYTGEVRPDIRPLSRDQFERGARFILEDMQDEQLRRDIEQATRRESAQRTARSLIE
jgi:hypothetical protein